jgi:hypothetical protein
MGDIEFSVNGVDFRINFGWVSTLGFALRFLKTVTALADEGESLLEFAEDPAWIKFQRDPNGVVVTSSYAPGSAKVRYGELLSAVQDGLTALLDTLSVIHENYQPSR